MLYECITRSRRRARKNKEGADMVRPGELNQYQYELCTADAAGLIQLCLWEALAGNGSSSVVTPGNSSKSGLPPNMCSFSLSCVLISMSDILHRGWHVPMCGVCSKVAGVDMRTPC